MTNTRDSELQIQSFRATRATELHRASELRTQERKHTKHRKTPQNTVKHHFSTLFEIL